MTWRLQCKRSAPDRVISSVTTENPGHCSRLASDLRSERPIPFILAAEARGICCSEATSANDKNRPYYAFPCAFWQTVEWFGATTFEPCILRVWSGFYA